MAVRQSHWSCNGSTSQLPYCTTKSITTPALLPTPSFRHREPAAASRTFTLLVLANTHVDDRRLSLVTSIAGGEEFPRAKIGRSDIPGLAYQAEPSIEIIEISRHFAHASSQRRFPPPVVSIDGGSSRKNL